MKQHSWASMNFNNNLEKQMKPLLNTARPHRDGFCTVMCAARHKLPTTAANILNTKHLSITKNLLFYSVSPKCPQGHDLSDWELFTNASEKAFFDTERQIQGENSTRFTLRESSYLLKTSFPTTWALKVRSDWKRYPSLVSEIKFVHPREHVNDILLHPTFLTGECFTLVPRSAFGGN